ncbi:MAG TPA: hypothetical protein VGA50_04575 [Kiloniellales bacterium]
MTDYTVGDTIHLMFTTRQFSTGTPFTLAGTPVVSAYEDDSLTQITAGITLGVDHDGVTGLNLLTIVASGANGFETGKDYSLVITTGTVDSVSVVGEVVAEFTLGRSAAAVDLANGTDGLGAIKADTALILADTNELQGDWVDGGRLDLILDARASQASLDVVDGVADAILIDTGTTIPGVLGTPAGASLAADLVAIAAFIDTEVAAILEDTGTTLPALIAALNDVSAADVLAQARAALTTQITESYAANGVAPTYAECLMAIHQAVMHFAITGATKAVKKLDGSAAFSITHDTAASPTSASRV